MKRIVICGGHLTPAQAVIEELKKEDRWQIYYFGRKYAMEGKRVPSAESKIIPLLGIKFIPIAAGRLQRKFTRFTIPSLLRVPLGFFQSLYWLLKIRPLVICSFGGYVSVPVVLAGWLLRIPILTHEQTTVFGLASKINSFFASKIAVSFPESLKFFPKEKVILTGNPIRQEIFKIRKPSHFPLRPSPFPLIYITGGNQGAKVINRAVLEILPKLLGKYTIIHQCGELDYENLKLDLRENYILTKYVGLEDIGWVLNKADLIVSRAGANIVCEIAALGKPALFIPIPWSYQDEQTKNAQMLVKAGIAEILPQKELTGPSLLNKISEMMANLEKYQRNAPEAKKLIKPDSSLKIVKELNDLSKPKKP
ncbi:MAG: UDP-N-acetylglucosamine--N-acetylmuramyl-(pentapeptide) pyrophosphoryl-undecaprenol N-acetylglucosamine transferase [Patescibacteria group bacterium]